MADSKLWKVRSYDSGKITANYVVRAAIKVRLLSSQIADDDYIGAVNAELKLLHEE